jgi:hypothetical protein
MTPKQRQRSEKRLFLKRKEGKFKTYNMSRSGKFRSANVLLH